MGSGTTAAVAKKLGRNFIGIEKEAVYIKVANNRLKEIEKIENEFLSYAIEERKPKVPLATWLKQDLLM